MRPPALPRVIAIVFLVSLPVASAQESSTAPAAVDPSAESPQPRGLPPAASEPAGGADGADGTGGATTEDANAPRHPETYLDFAVSGGTLMIPIGIASVLLLAFVVERLVSTRRVHVLPNPFVEAIRSLTAESTLDRGRVDAVCTSHPSSASRILKTALAKIDETREEIGHAVNVVAQREIFSLRRYTRLFLIIASVAPLIGLLGTVTGMIQAFREVAIQGLGSGQALAPGIYQALITTAAGLLVAIPAMIAYYWMMARIDNYVHSIDNLVEDFVDWGRGRLAAAGWPAQAERAREEVEG